MTTQRARTLDGCRGSAGDVAVVIFMRALVLALGSLVVHGAALWIVNAHTVASDAAVVYRLRHTAAIHAPASLVNKAEAAQLSGGGGGAAAALMMVARKCFQF
jgi:hypothetical protein